MSSVIVTTCLKAAALFTDVKHTRVALTGKVWALDYRGSLVIFATNTYSMFVHRVPACEFELPEPVGMSPAEVSALPTLGGIDLTHKYWEQGGDNLHLPDLLHRITAPGTERSVKTPGQCSLKQLNLAHRARKMLTKTRLDYDYVYYPEGTGCAAIMVGDDTQVYVAPLSLSRQVVPDYRELL